MSVVKVRIVLQMLLQKISPLFSKSLESISISHLDPMMKIFHGILIMFINILGISVDIDSKGEKNFLMKKILLALIKDSM